MDNNYNEFDYQTIVVKKEKADQITKDYASFGWQKIDDKQHKLYENLVEIKFQRKHKIVNKDDLQFMQVNYEHYTNLMARTEKNKHQKSLIFGLSMLVLIASLVALSVLSMQNFVGVIKIIVCSLCVLFDLIFIVLTCIIQPKIIKKEKIIFEQNVKECRDNINKICSTAKKLL